MPKKILYIKPTAVHTMDEQIRSYLAEYAEEGTTVDVVTVPCGPKHLEYEYYLALAGPWILQRVREAEKKGYDGAVIGCFDDPCLDAAREICDHMCVSGPAEAAMGLAAVLGEKFSVIVGRDKWIPTMMQNVVKYGHKDRLASFRSLGMGVLDFQQDHKITEARMREEIRAAIEQDKAEVVILGCTMEFGFFRKLQEEFSVPILDAMLCGFKNCEYLVELKHTAGWYASKRGRYEGPDPKEIRDWNLPEDFHMGDIWD